MSRVFTIFCCGTCSNSFDFANEDYWSGELVSTLAHNHAGGEFVDWVCLDGPGSGGFQQKGLWAESFSSGLGNKVTQGLGVGLGKQWEQNAEAAVAYIKGLPKWWGKGTEVSDGKVTADPLKNGWFSDEQGPIVDSLMQMMQGHQDSTAVGADEIVGKKISGYKFMPKTRQRNAIRSVIGNRPRITPQMLQQKKVEIFRKDAPITTVNLIGWSRGAVTTHMIANRLLQALPDVVVNIIACDPVPGLGNFQSHRCHLGRNVSQYVGIFSTHEMSVGFTPICPTTTSGTARTIVSMWGRHGTSAGNASKHGGGAADEGDDVLKRFKEPGIIARDMSEKLLASWGTKLGDTLDLSNEQILTHYEAMLGDRDAYDEMRKHQYTVRQRGGEGSGIGDGWKAQQRHVALNEKAEASFSLVPGLEPYGPFVNAHHLAVALKECNFTMKLGMRTSAPSTFNSLNDAMQLLTP